MRGLSGSMMRIGWDGRADEADLFLNQGTQDEGAHNSGPSPDCIDDLLGKGAFGWGTQYLGADAGMVARVSLPCPAHTPLHRDSCFGLASLSSLDQLAPKGAVFIAAPGRAAAKTGATIRALTRLPS
jgi:isatin hydrolase